MRGINAHSGMNVSRWRRNNGAASFGRPGVAGGQYVAIDVVWWDVFN